ncbi:hypothetical protein [Bradyrhizobium sp. USDA 4454]
MKYPAWIGKASRGTATPTACITTSARGTIARLDAGECMRSMTEARARELENLGHQ